MDINTLFEESFKEVDDKVGNLFKIQSSETKDLLKRIKEFKDRITKSKNFLNAQTALRGAEKNIARTKVNPEEIKNKIQSEIDITKNTREQYIQLSNHKAAQNLLNVLNKMVDKENTYNVEYKTPDFHKFNSKLDPKKAFILFVNERPEPKKGEKFAPRIMDIFEQLYYDKVVNSNPELKNAVNAVYKCYKDLEKTFKLSFNNIGSREIKIINQDAFNTKFQTFYNIIKRVQKEVDEETKRINDEIKGYKTGEDKFTKRGKELSDFLEQNKGKDFLNVSAEDLRYYNKKYNEFLDAKEALMSLNINTEKTPEIKSDIKKSFEEIENIKSAFESIKKRLEADGITEKYFVENYKKIRASNEALFNIIFDTYNFFYNTNMTKEQKKEIRSKGEIYDEKMIKYRDRAGSIIEEIKKFPNTENIRNYINNTFFDTKLKTDIEKVENEVKNLVSETFKLKTDIEKVEQYRREMENRLSGNKKDQANARYYKILTDLNNKIRLINSISDFYSSIGEFKKVVGEYKEAADISKIVDLIEDFKKKEKKTIEEMNRQFIEEQLGKEKAKEYIVNMWKSGGNQPEKVFKTEAGEEKFYSKWVDPYRQKADEIFNEANKLAKQKEELIQKKIDKQITAERKAEGEAKARAKEAQAEYYGDVSKDDENAQDQIKRVENERKRAKEAEGIRNKKIDDIIRQQAEEDAEDEDRLNKASKKVLAELSGKKPSKVKKEHTIVIKKKKARKLNKYAQQAMKELIDKEK